MTRAQPPIVSNNELEYDVQTLVEENERLKAALQQLQARLDNEILSARLQRPEGDETESAPYNSSIARICEDASSKAVGVLTKTPYVRPSHPKIICQYCTERPEGFRDTHELERHMVWTHASNRKGYICVNYSADKKTLASCKDCYNEKVYGACYDAAFHLRRAHFPIAGHPSLNHLTQYWIKEVEVDNKAPDPLADSDGSQPEQRTAEDTVQQSSATLPQGLTLMDRADMHIDQQDIERPYALYNVDSDSFEENQPSPLLNAEADPQLFHFPVIQYNRNDSNSQITSVHSPHLSPRLITQQQEALPQFQSLSFGPQWHYS